MIFCAIPLIFAFSLCYAATRHEAMGLIFPHAARFGGWLAFFMVLVVALMELIYRFIH